MQEGVPTLGELGRRMSALEHDVEELRELTDGQQRWSHRHRLHRLENDKRSAELVRQALDAFRVAEHRASRSKWAQVREWGSFAVAVAAIVVAILARWHGA